MDHFFGFDRLLRICLGRDKNMRWYGPPDFAAQVGHELAGYTWNLVENYPGDFVVDVWEVESARAESPQGAAAAAVTRRQTDPGRLSMSARRRSNRIPAGTA